MNNQIRIIFSESCKISNLINLFQKTCPFHTTTYNLVKLTNTLKYCIKNLKKKKFKLINFLKNHSAEPTKAKKRIDPAVLQLRYAV